MYPPAAYNPIRETLPPPGRAFPVNDPRRPSVTRPSASRRRAALLAVAAIVAVAVGVYHFWPKPDRRGEALRLAKQGKLREAEPLLLTVLERHGDDADVVAALALAKLGGTDHAAAEQYLSRWGELRPAEAKPFQLRMDLRHRTARGMTVPAERVPVMEAALADGRRVLALDAGNDPVRREVAWLALQIGQHEVAETECRRVLASSPADPWMNYLLAKSCHAGGKRAEAATLLDGVIRTQPGFADALLLRAILHHEGDQPDRAIPLLRHALTQKGCPRRECLYRLGLALGATGQTEEAGRVLAEVELLNLTGAVANDHFPNNPAMRVQIAEAMLGVGRLPDAAAELDAILTEAPDFAPAHRVKALYFDRTGQPDKAAEHRRRAGKDAQ